MRDQKGYEEIFCFVFLWRNFARVQSVGRPHPSDGWPKFGDLSDLDRELRLRAVGHGMGRTRRMRWGAALIRLIGSTDPTVRSFLTNGAF